MALIVQRVLHPRSKLAATRLWKETTLSEELEVYPGNTADPTTVPDQIDELKKRFGLERVVVVGDRAMLTQAQVATLGERPGIGWLSALRSEAIREWIRKGQGGTFAVRRAEPGGNPLAGLSERAFDCLLQSVLAGTAAVEAGGVVSGNGSKVSAERGGGGSADENGADGRRDRREGRARAEQAQVGKHFELTIEDNPFQWRRREEAIQEEADPDGGRTSS